LRPRWNFVTTTRTFTLEPTCRNWLCGRTERYMTQPVSEFSLKCACRSISFWYLTIILCICWYVLHKSVTSRAESVIV
jgi:hypothetical protein